MFYAYQKSFDLAIMQENKPLLENFHQNIAATLQNISLGIEQNKTPDTVLIDNIASLKKSLANMTQLEHDQRISVDAFIFCAEILVERLEKIIALLKNINSLE
jgi:hypothetical protein